VIFNGVSYYFKTGLKISVKRSRVKIDTDAFGQIAEVAKDTVVTMTGTPVGAIRGADIAGQMPYAPSGIGGSIFGAEDVPLVVQTIADGQQITWSRGAISKYPSILLSATKGTIYKGDMTFACLMASNFTLTGNSAWNSVAAEAFADTTFDPAKVRMGQYTAAWGAVAPYSSMVSQEGFTLTPSIETTPIDVDNYGVIDMVLKSMTGLASFMPANLTEAQTDTLINLQGGAAWLPGQAIGDGGNNLVVTGPHLVATLVGAGAVDYDLMYATGKLRSGEVAFGSALTFTAGVPNPIFTFTVD
jgi:hypothetical protein